MAADLYGLGALLSPSGEEVTPTQDASTKNSYVEGWKQALGNPTTQAALFNMGIQMMAPRWQPQSAVPDAMQAVAGTFTKEAERQTAERQRAEDQSRADAARAEARSDRKEELAADRASRMDIARLHADSRAEVANIRSAALAERAQLTGKKDPLTSEELKFWTSQYAAERKRINDSFASRRMTPSEQDALARAAADRALDGFKATFPRPAGGAGAGPETRRNLGRPGGPGVGPGAAAVPAGTSENKVTAAEMMAMLRAQGIDPRSLIDDHRRREQIYARVSDPLNLPRDIFYDE